MPGIIPQESPRTTEPDPTDDYCDLDPELLTLLRPCPACEVERPCVMLCKACLTVICTECWESITCQVWEVVYIIGC